MYDARESLHLSEAGGLAQFVAHVHTLQPGSRSSDRHWHEEEDEFLYMLSGEATVIEEDGPHLLRPGDAACWPAGTANAHQVVNRSGALCSYLILGSGWCPTSSTTLTEERSCTTSSAEHGGCSAPTGP
ncbi:MAG TPA: cupin domain-containing protein [Rubrobacter sp.]|nr:cupin domain-containing protein [Rubrobacter sp.]